MSVKEKNINISTLQERLKKCGGHMLTQDEIKKKEDAMDQYDLEISFKYGDIKIKTMKDLRNLVRTFENTKQIEKIENLITDEDYYYIFNWYLKKFCF